MAAIVAALLSAVATPALASTAEAGLADFQIRLVDLDPADGILPSVVFQELEGGAFVAAETGTPPGVVTDALFAGLVFGPAVATSAQGTAAAYAALSGDAFGAGASATASASAKRAGDSGASTVQLGDGGIVVPFTLSAHTRLVITADASASAMSTFDDLHADTWASVFLKLTDGTGQGDAVSDGVSAEQASTLGAPPSATTDAHRIEISFENLAAGAADGLFFGSIDAYSADPAPVPEPAGFATALAALGALAWRLRRRAR